MNPNAIFVVILVVALIIVAFITVGDLGVSGGPVAQAPNSNAEFGVVVEKKTFLSSFRKTPPPSSQQQTKTEEDILEKNITINRKNAKLSDVDREYITIQYSSRAKESIDLTDWKVENTRGSGFVLGRVSNLPGRSSSSLDNDRLIVPPGGRVHVITGRSPRGENFRVNKCSGYFNQTKTYTPFVPHSCPSPKNEPGQDGFSDECFNYVKRLPSCKIPSPLPTILDDRCRNYVIENISYAGCIDNHKTDDDFYKDEWWVYLKRPDQLWSDSRDTIYLKNSSGVLIKSYSYQ
ncbi:MAG: hypothetical protein O2794_02200 [bacterium]|nr:hypothetical protein [bacterium]